MQEPEKDVMNDEAVASENAETQTAAEPEGAAAEPELSSEEEVIAAAEAVVTAAEELEKARAELVEANEKYLRLHAEWDTYRRRMNEQRAEDKKQASAKLVEDIIPVLDDFERTINYAATNGETGLIDGVKAVYTKLVDALVKSGVEVIDPQGQAYNALEAQAIQMLEDPSVPDETVSQVFQKGYKMGVKVLRPAMVVVTTGGPKREVEEEGE